ncbi:hypothetical protein AX17_001956 [Amanita inopinata Kibby_2008]|nr:hypothetical protein AX17_001956 [Amanita inopinata Kibby_2008]
MDSNHEMTMTPSTSPLYHSSDIPSNLASPIHLADSAIRLPSLLFRLSRSAPKYRNKPLIPVSHPCRTPRCKDYSPHVFDTLPWISLLDATSDALSLGDIADLSQITVSQSSAIRTSSIGPIRRKNPSLHFNPLQHANLQSTPNGVLSADARPGPPDPNRRQLGSRVTPHSYFKPSRVSFHQLMPTSIDSSAYDLYDYKQQSV